MAAISSESLILSLTLLSHLLVIFATSSTLAGHEMFRKAFIREVFSGLMSGVIRGVIRRGVIKGIFRGVFAVDWIRVYRVHRSRQSSAMPSFRHASGVTMS